MVKIKMKQPSDLKHGLTKLLAKYSDVFTWRPKDRTGIPMSIIEHCLNINPGFPPIKQRKRIIVSEQNIIVNQKVPELVHAGVVQVTRFPP